MAERAQVSVRGIVQGVGFRPYVYALATGLGLKGYVTNTADGVLIDVEGPAVPDFIRRLPAEAPPLSRITDIVIIPLPLHGTPDFTIKASQDHSGKRAFTHISPDISICADCLRELADPSDRRYRYPFINCTNCGPRYTITKAVPYDRPNTTMASFTLCSACLKEYNDPTNRRFHAQPNACPACGPQVEFRERGSASGVRGTRAITRTIDILKSGGSVAIKGLGGFHIACNALNDSAVRQLRERKRKSNKPFAIMALSIDAIGCYCEISPEEQGLLESAKRPIVLLRKKVPAPKALSDALSPRNQYLGCMLPYTPLHYLLFTALEKETTEGLDDLSALVMTSGNLSEEPIIHRNDDAVEKLSSIVDAFLLHDRDIFMRVDDSVVRVRGNERQGTGDIEQSEKNGSSPAVAGHSPLMFLRRARGFTPEAIALRDSGPEVLGCGADLKNTFTLTKGSFAIPSQHIGDMENYETLKLFEESLANLRQVYRVDPVVIAHDLHPGYVSTRWAKETGSNFLGLGAGRTVQLVPIQHHYAHIGSVMAERSLIGPVIGVAFDGTGYGTDGNLWGGEFFIAGIDRFERVGQLKYIPLPGGEAAIREPWRTAISYITDAAGMEAHHYLAMIGFRDRYGHETVGSVGKIATSRELSPLSSGAGRLFDAVSAILGVCDVNTFEGEAAMALESLTVGGRDDEYPVVLKEENEYTVVDFAATIKAVIDEMSRNESKQVIATRFHNTVATVVRNMVLRVHQRTGILDVALSGGTFQNLYLLSMVTNVLTADGMRVHTNSLMPPNDACISLGQAYLARERLKKETKS
jgi:hydrogenase maturation protein HypF